MAPAVDIDALGAAARAAYADLAGASAPLIGQVGVDALAGRALHLAQREYPWLAGKGDPDPPEPPFARVIACVRRQELAVATQATASVLAIFIGLLVTFIGRPLTSGLVRKAWPDASLDATTKES